MTLWSRAVVGALLGAIATLIIHPVSRPFLLNPFIESSRLIESRGPALPTSFPANLPEPVDDASASLWVHVGAEQLRNRGGLTDAQGRGLVKLVQFRGSKDPTNAFWRMAESVFQVSLGDRSAALIAWSKAAKCLHYDDYQSRYLSRVRNSLSNSTAGQSWQYAYCYRLRSFALSEQIEAFARKAVAKLGRTSKDDLEWRYITLLNGVLLRDGSRSLETMARGISIVEIASHPRELQKQNSIKRLLIAHSEFKEALKSVNMADQAANVENQYDENDGWSALTRREDTAEKLNNLTLFSALWPNLPGVLLQISLLGLVIWRSGNLLLYLLGRKTHVATIFVLSLAIFLVIAVMLMTRSWLAVLATSLSCAFVFLAPKSVRTTQSSELGPLFTFCISTLSSLLFALAAVLFLSRTLPVVASIGWVSEQYQPLGDFNLAGGLAAIVIAFVFLLAPLFSFALRVKTYNVLAAGLQSMGATLAFAGLTLAMASTPICIYFENQNAETFRMLMENEPVYYVRQ